jgi:alpha-aminoadipic semialdehyde synthase
VLCELLEIITEIFSGGASQRIFISCAYLIFLYFKRGAESEGVMKKIGIRKEDKNQFEGRVPLIPDHCKLIIDNFNIPIKIQPSNIRTFEDQEFSQAGCVVDENILDCDLILGVKEIPADMYQKDKVYMCFSHTIKGQDYNMPTLKKILESEATLLDYELITNQLGQRTVYFSTFAGYVGAAETLWTIGRRWALEGFHTPFEKLRRPYEYKNLAHLKMAIGLIGKELISDGIPQDAPPIIIGVTGSGSVSMGALNILQILPHKYIQPEDLLSSDFKPDTHFIYIVHLKRKYRVAPIYASDSADSSKFFEKPQEYKSIVESYLEKCTALINGVYWEEGFPRIATKSFIRKHYESKKYLRVIADISCDIHGSVEFTEYATQPDAPVFTYNPLTEKPEAGFTLNGPNVMAVDNLPAEISRDSSEYFSESLIGYVPMILETDFSKPFDKLVLPEFLKRAIIVHKGELTPGFRYLQKFIDK